MKNERIRIKVVAAVIVSGGEVLISSRADDDGGELFWEFPGGKVEDGERFNAALEREIREELGVEIVVFDQIYHVEHSYGEKDVELFFFRCAFSGDEGKGVRGCEGQELRWCRVEELSGQRLLPADRPLAEFLSRAAYFKEKF